MSTHRHPIRAAVGKIEITPSKPVYLAGYAPNRLSVGDHDPIWGRCLVIQSGSETVALLIADLLGVPRHLGQKIKRATHPIPSSQLLIGATHTHSAPDTYGLWGPDLGTSGVDKIWLEEIIHKLGRLVDDTFSRLQPARLQFGCIEVEPGISRNDRVPAILDRDLTVMNVIGEGGNAISTLVNYACHPEVLNNRMITSDFPHWLRSEVENRLGGTCLFTNGALGGMVTADFNSELFPHGEAWSEAQRIGRLLADYALKAIKDQPILSEASLAFHRSRFQVPLMNERFGDLIRSQIIENHLSKSELIATEMVYWTLGSAGFLTLPGEVLPNIGLFLKRKMPSHPKFLLGLTGDALGYILTQEDYYLDIYRYEASMSIGPVIGPALTDHGLKLFSKGQPRP
ncbi:MAG: hypothetical protein M1330_01040 [Armatimonadetes bacterium]|nr:hypothetical protein [Armatimonadota bacterium]